jgi:hypothetical protein
VNVYEWLGKTVKVICIDGKGYVDTVLGAPDYEPEEQSIMLKGHGENSGVEILTNEIEEVA